MSTAKAPSFPNYETNMPFPPWFGQVLDAGYVIRFTNSFNHGLIAAMLSDEDFALYPGVTGPFVMPVGPIEPIQNIPAPTATQLALFNRKHDS